MYGMEHQDKNKQLLSQIADVDAQIKEVEQKLNAEVKPSGEKRMDLLNQKMDLINAKSDLIVQVTETKRNWGGPTVTA